MLKLFKIILDLHDGEGAGADAGADAGTGDAASAADGEAVAAGQQTEVSEVDTAKEFSDLIRGKYKNEYKAATQELINKRFAKAKETEAKLAEQNGIIGLLHQRYGTRSNAALLEALENDESYLEQRALDLGMTREQAQEYDRMQRQIAQYQDKEAKAEQQRKADEQVSQWMSEAEALRAKFPDFDIETELQNESFRAQLANGISVELAYKTTHFDELMQSNTAYAAQQTAKKVTENIRARGARPQEIGASNKASFTSSTDISKLSGEQIKNYIKRAARGENITFR